MSLELNNNKRESAISITELFRSEVNAYKCKLIKDGTVHTPTAFLKFLHNKTNISVTVARRIISGAPFKTDFNMIIKVFAQIHNKHEIPQLMAAIPEWAQTYIQAHLESPVNYRLEMQDAKVDEAIFSSSDTFDLYVFISPFGRTVEEIQIEFGKQGLKKMDDLIGTGAIVVHSDFVRWNPEKGMLINALTHKRFATSLVKQFFDPKMVNIPNENIINYRVHEVTLKSYKKIISKVTDLKNEVDQLINIDRIMAKEDDEKVKFFTVNTVDRIDRAQGKAIDFKRS